MLRPLLPAALLMLAFSSCATARSGKEPPMDASAKEIIQMAQNAFNVENFRLAENYYNVLLQRYGNDTTTYIIGKYEIAHIAMRKKDYKTAVPLLNEILDLYVDTPAGELPASYRVLAQNERKRIPNQIRMTISADGKGNDYYEYDDYGDTDFFGTPIGDSDADSSDSASDDGYYDYNGDYASGFYW